MPKLPRDLSGKDLATLLNKKTRLSLFHAFSQEFLELFVSKACIFDD
jgi:hypothetical protein